MHLINLLATLIEKKEAGYSGFFFLIFGNY